MNTTGVTSQWVLVYEGNVCYYAAQNSAQETVSDRTIETFDTEEEMVARIEELGMTRPPVYYETASEDAPGEL